MSIREIRELLIEEGERRRRLGLLAVLRELADDWDSRDSLSNFSEGDLKSDAGDSTL